MTIQNPALLEEGVEMLVQVAEIFFTATDKVRRAIGLPAKEEEFTEAWGKLPKAKKEFYRAAFYAAVKAAAKKKKVKAPSESKMKRWAEGVGLRCRAERSDKGKNTSRSKEAAMEAAVRKCDSQKEAEAVFKKAVAVVFSK